MKVKLSNSTSTDRCAGFLSSRITDFGTFPLSIIFCVTLTACSAEGGPLEKKHCRALLPHIAEASESIEYGDEALVKFILQQGSGFEWPPELKWERLETREQSSAQEASGSLGFTGTSVEVSQCTFEPDEGGNGDCIFFFFRDPDASGTSIAKRTIGLEAVLSEGCING